MNRYSIIAFIDLFIVWLIILGWYKPEHNSQWKIPQYLHDTRLGGPRSWSQQWQREKIPAPCWESNSGYPDHSTVTML